MRCVHIGEGIGHYGAFRSPINLYIRYLVSGIRGEGKFLART